MAWWRSRKRDAQQDSITETDSEIGGSAERAQARGSQPSAVPNPRAERREGVPEADSGEYEVEVELASRELRHELTAEQLLLGPEEEQISEIERWHLIKQDLAEIDPDFITDLEQIAADARDEAAPLDSDRIIASLRNLDIRYLVDENGGIVALWERHIVQVRAEGPDADILVLRARAYQTVPREWAERGYAAMNEWNRTRRFLKAYLGEPTESGALPVFGEIQVPVRPGITTALLEELIDCGTAISGTFVEWLEGELL
ncbi:YbjN domain-containing protein [Glycomyces harbinensis]|uniref:Putative sensory transduction regulator n=1 Tax=Glycomyces harbinensis TaxID=58114 RepID=A0A1G6SUU4_9ACTN|nr:YbjN domain-containing protein [Glycomyces harbinensis]SDD20563.1 Putative sensory transduction regulator [Glycomyces harbinensis]